MAFHNVRMPKNLSYAYQGGPGFRTQVHVTDSGFEERVQRWLSARYVFVAQKNLRTPLDMHALLRFFLARRGAANVFRFKDLLDFTSNPSDGRTAPHYQDQELGVGDGTTTVFQLRKQYDSGSETYVRNITHPVVDQASGGVPGDSMTVTVAFDGVEQPTGWSVNGTTGEVTFTAAPGVGVLITAGFEFDVPVRFGVELDQEYSQTLEAFDAVSLPQIPLVEVRDEGHIPESWDPGGALEANLTESETLSMASPRFHKRDAQSAGLNMYLPKPGDLGSGWGYFRFVNDSGSNTYDVRDDAGNLIVTVPTGGATVKRIALRDNGDGTKTWLAFS